MSTKALRLGDSPEHLFDAQANLPAVTKEEETGFPQIEMGAPWIRVVVPEERDEREAPALAVLDVECRLGDESAGCRALAREGWSNRKQPALRYQAPGEVHGQRRTGIIVGLRLGGSQEGREEDHAERSTPTHPAGSHHRVLRRPVDVKSLSSRPVPNR